MHRFLHVMVALIGVILSTSYRSAGQDMSTAAAPLPGQAYRSNLAFSKDGRVLREIGTLSPVGTEQFWHVRATTYVVATGKVRHVWNLRPDTWAYSATSDGRTVVISVNRERPEEQARAFLLDTESGHTQDMPSNWFETDDRNPYAAISGDGQLVSTYWELSPEDGGMVVEVYGWRSKRLVARRVHGFFAGGIMWGGVTEDGKIVFSNNRSGSDIVDLKTGRLIVSVTPYSFRSPDGKWIVEFPDLQYEDAPRYIKIENGTSGKEIGKLDFQVTDDEGNRPPRGAFCGTSGKFIVASAGAVRAYEIPSGKQIATFPAETWRDANSGDYAATLACTSTGKRVAIRSGTRLTLHDLK